MPLSAEDVGTFLLEVVKYGGGAVVIAYGIVKVFGEKWLDSRFATALQKMKYEQQKELERVKDDIQRTYNRISKVHDKEYEVLPKAWLLFHEAHGYVYNLMGFYRTVGFAAMNEDAVDAFLKTTKLDTHEYAEVKNANDREEYFRTAIQRHYHRDARQGCRVLRNYIIEHQIFMTPTIQHQFDDAATKLASALALWESAQRTTMPNDYEGQAIQILEDLRAVMPTMQAAIQTRLCFDQAGPIANDVS